MIDIKSDNDIYNEILTDLRTDLETGIASYRRSPLDDIFIQPLLGQVSDTYILADFISRSRSLTELKGVIESPTYINRLSFALNYTYQETLDFISNTITNLVADYSVVRKTAEVSRGYVRLYFNEGSAKTFSAGIILTTQSGLRFTTTNSFTNLLPEYDATQGLYYIDSAINSVLAGSQYNVEGGAITKIETPIQYLTGCVNIQRTQFGRDIETDKELITRTLDELASRKTSVFSGLINLVRNYVGVSDVSIVMPGSINQVRYDKNAVDIYIIGEQVAQLKEDIFHSTNARYAWNMIDEEINFNIYPTSYDSTGYSYFKLLSQPAIDVNSVQYSTDSGASYNTLTGWELFQDTTSSCRLSVKGHDYVKVPNENIPDDSLLKVVYSYDKMFKNLQTLMLNYENYIIGADLLFKRGREVPVDIYVEPVLFNGFNETTVKENIVINLRRFFEGGVDLNGVQRYSYKLGQTLDLSDIINVIIDTGGVDYINVETFTSTIEGDSSWQRYSPSFADYLRLGTVTFGAVTITPPSPIRNINVIIPDPGGVE